MILCFGENAFGQLGIGNLQRDHPSDPFPFGISEDTTLEHSAVADIQCGSKFSVRTNISCCGNGPAL
jgi:alpha-tubulin suppressor-like RCC1 family protein